MEKRRVLMLSYVFPPMSSVGGFRAIRFTKYLPQFGWSPLVLAPSTASLDPAQIDPSLESLVPSGTVVVRARVFRPAVRIEKAVRAVRRQFRRWLPGPHEALDASSADTRKNQPAEKRSWLQRAVRGALTCAFELPDEQIGWLFPALRAGMLLIRKYRPRAIYSSGPPHSTHLIAVALKFLSGLPLAIDLRDPWSRGEWQRHDASGWRVQGSLERFCVRWSDRVILNTPRLCDDFRGYYGEAHRAKFLAITNGYDPDLLPLAGELLARNVRPCPNGSIRVCHPGNVYGERNLKSVATAIGRLAKAGCRVTFEQVGTLAHSSSLLEYLRANQWDSYFQIRGRVSHGETLARMAAADVLLVLQPGTSVQVPGKLFEMLPFRKPLVAVTGEGATADIVRQFGLGFVADPGDPEAIAAAILRAGSGGLQAAGNLCREQALGAFDGRRLAGMLAETLQGLL
jgi:glycosyltransferase involved in cell wall biosynthesis